MIRELELHIQRNDLFSKKDKLLLAVSGGLDSVVLAHLLKKGGYTFALAHCNFKLRGAQSNADESFCKKLANELGVAFYAQGFDTKTYSKAHKLNTQLAARTLRYNWFNQIIKDKKFDFLITAHHANDSIETIILNLSRGTGINGVKGIPEKNGNIRRPLLPFSREQILEFAKKQKISYREDQSNSDDVYDRNFIRHHIIPKLKELNPILEETFVANSTHFNEEAAIVNSYLENRASELVTQTHDSVFIAKKKLAKEPYAQTLLHHLLSGYGFNATQQKNILQHLKDNRLSGKLFHSPTHRLTVDRNDLVIKANSEQSFNDVKIQSLADLKKINFFRVGPTEFSIPASNELIVDEKRLIFPISFRPVKKGDKFRPFGMRGFKLLSDFMKDQKLNAFQKENCRLLVNGNGEIIWVAGYRSDDRYKVETGTPTLLKIKYIAQ